MHHRVVVEISTLTAGRLSTPARERALQSVVAAFAVDPLLRWVWPDEDRYAGCAGRFFGLLLDLRLMGGEVWVAGGGAAVAVPADAGPYWYLGVLATDPAYQRRGLASAVLAPVLAAADRTGTPAYLETASATNVAYYARHGFIPAREVDLADGPRCWLMRRDAQVRCG